MTTQTTSTAPTMVAPHPYNEFVRAAVMAEIEIMLEQLQHPPLVDKIYPNGWRNEKDLGVFYELCRRSILKRLNSVSG